MHRLRSVREWLYHRGGFDWLEGLLHEEVPARGGWIYTLGSTMALLLALQFITGIALTVYYVPDAVHAFDSVVYITEEVAGGQFIRSTHRWCANMIFVVVGLHMLQVFLAGAYKPPREMTWMLGVVNFILLIGIGLTGGLLAFDQNAFWIGTVGANAMAYVPLIGDWLRRVLLGGNHLSSLTVSRFFALHIWILPGLLVLTIAYHLLLMRRHGLFGAWFEYRDQLQARRAGGHGGTQAARAAGDPPPPVTATGSHGMTYLKPDRYVPFWPDQVYKDAVVSSVVLGLVAFFAWAWPVVAERGPDPAGTVVPRPEWFFFAIDQMLTYFPGGFLTYVGILFIGGFFVLLFLVPFLDHGTDADPFHRIGTIAAGLGVLFFMVTLTVLAWSRIVTYTVIGF